MAGHGPRLPTRLIICVDGTARSPGGGQTSINRIYAGVKRGKCFCSASGTTFEQIPRYIPGIGSADDAFSTDRIQASVLGKGYLKQIQDVYEACSQLTGSRDEVWLFGFSRGSFVVRAVADLLNRFQALASAAQPEFGNDFKKLFKEAGQSQGQSSILMSPVCTRKIKAIREADSETGFIYIFSYYSSSSQNKIRWGL